ncbi:hypothetical protein [Streptacidiphilus sp. PAMC 29251]
MGNRDDELMALFRSLDDPDWMERPASFDGAAVVERFDRLVSRVEDTFYYQCSADRWTQDSSEFARLTIPEQATVCRERIVICVSKFGNLAMTAAENPGAYLDLDDAMTEGAIDSGDRTRVEALLTDAGYVVVSESFLGRRYDGVSDLARYHSAQYPPDWWDRFFGVM